MEFPVLVTDKSNSQKNNAGHITDMGCGPYYLTGSVTLSAFGVF